jgi:BirA family transcriptional regulator, biotin operon repressor / biotin---[acetyl-CoA-carboxylase] ligase
MRGSGTGLGSSCDDPAAVGTALGQHSLERAARGAGIDAPPVWLDETGSTNDDARRLAEGGAPAWTVVAAGHQTAGRGRLGRSWADTPGKALTFSVILRPRLEPARAPLVTLAAAAVMVAAAELPGMGSKWPNDLVVGDRKVGGILTDAAVEGAALRHLVLGIEVNLSMTAEDFPPEVRSTATSLAAAGGPDDAERLLVSFLRLFRPACDRLPGDAVERYRKVCTTLGRRVRAWTTEGQEVEGIAAGLDDRGGLIVETPAGRRTVAFGEVAHLG